mmetsp:Transcript_7450/g.15548  ORF Transcript_7450/g.15548 Transcript_7450/m.15548 type:complete len:429 (-) Transcript_7450:2251-3537(-)
MSLLSSIFGSEPSNEEGNSSLFDKKRALDESDDDVSASDEKRQKKNDDNSDDSSSSDSDGSGSDDGSSSSSEDEQEEKDSSDITEEPTTATNKDEDAAPKEEAPTVENDTKQDGKTDESGERTVFVGNLPCAFTRKGLEKLFRPCGAIDSTRIRSVATTGVKVPQSAKGNQKLVKKVSANLNKVDTAVKSTVVGYVVFREAGESIEAALKLNNTPVADPATNELRRIRVDHVKTEQDASRSTFVGNLPYRTDEETLRKHFVEGCGLQEGDIEGVRVVRDKETHQCKGFAYLLFKDKTLVGTALRLMHGSTYMNRELRVMVCSRKFNSNKGEARPSRKKKIKGVDGETLKPGVAAMRRLLEKEGAGKGPTTLPGGNSNKRMRGKKTSHKPTAQKASGMSRKATLEAKTNKRVKKLQKRVSKGMGKAKHG